jgi:anti-sigma B factor antagonist
MPGHVCSIEFDRIGPTSVVSMLGEWDLADVEVLNKQLGAVVAVTDRVLVDVTGVEFMDSSVIGVLIGAAMDVEARGGRLVIAADETRHANRVLRLAGVGHVVVLVGDRTSGMAALGVDDALALA